MIYRTREGDTADLIAWRVYGSTADAVLNALLEANPGLADHGPVLPANVVVELPTLEVPATTTPGVRLWD